MKQTIRHLLETIAKLNNSEQLQGYFLSLISDVERLGAVLDSLTEGILVCDSDHNLILANKFSERLLPLTQLHGDDVWVWKIIDDREISAFIKTTLLSGDRVDEREFETEVKGKQRLLAISIFPLVKDYQITGSLVHINDITEKRKKEARIRQIESLASLTTLAAGVAHEIKNPLGSISIHIQLLQKAFSKNEELYYLSHPEDRPDPNFSYGEKGPVAYFGMFHRYIDVINEEIDRLNHIVVDFLFAVRPMTLNLRESNFNNFLQEVAEFTAYELSDAQVDLELELDETLPLLDFDEQLMKQALLNLIQNAVAAMRPCEPQEQENNADSPQEGGGKIILKTERKDNEVILSVIDTGTGIPSNILAKIFEPYFTTKERGSGLGLTLVFKIIREHKGEISVTSKEGEGTCFTITLPIPQRDRRLLSSGEELRDASLATLPAVRSAGYDERFAMQEAK